MKYRKIAFAIARSAASPGELVIKASAKGLRPAVAILE